MIQRFLVFCFLPALAVVQAATQFDVPQAEVIVCADSLDSVCQASTACNANGQVDIDARDSYKLGGTSQRNGYWKIRGGYTITFPESCEVTCQGDCVCEGCKSSREVADFDSSSGGGNSGVSAATTSMGALFLVMAAWILA